MSFSATTNPTPSHTRVGLTLCAMALAAVGIHEFMQPDLRTTQVIQTTRPGSSIVPPVHHSGGKPVGWLKADHPTAVMSRESYPSGLTIPSSTSVDQVIDSHSTGLVAHRSQTMLMSASDSQVPQLEADKGTPWNSIRALGVLAVSFLGLVKLVTTRSMGNYTEQVKGYLQVNDAPEQYSRLSLATASAEAALPSEEEEDEVKEEAPTSGLGKLWKTITSVDYSLFLCLTFWYIGNYYYNISNKYALRATGGVDGAPLTVASLQLLVGVLYGLFLWIAPDARRLPQTSWDDIMKMIPLSIAFAGAHFSTVFAMSAGAVSFGQIVKASEPAFAALLGVTLYSQSVSKAKWLSLIPVIGGVCLASAAELDFSVAALISGVMANLFAAVKANENKKAMDTPGLKDRLGTVGNQFAVTMSLAWLLSLPFVLLAEWKQLPALVTAWTTNPVVSFNTISAGLWFYLYNELATIVVKKTGAVTQSVANTAKRVIVIVACGLVLGESLDTLKLVGCTIGILGVFLYSIIDDLVKPKAKPATAA